MGVDVPMSVACQPVATIRQGESAQYAARSARRLDEPVDLACPCPE